VPERCGVSYKHPLLTGGTSLYLASAKASKFEVVKLVYALLALVFVLYIHNVHADYSWSSYLHVPIANAAIEQTGSNECFCSWCK
jgi:hypothetical protein